MKVVEAKVEHCTDADTRGKDAAYAACVTVMSNGERVTQAARAATPNAAVMSAIHHCATVFTERMKAGVAVGMSVSF